MAVTRVQSALVVKLHIHGAMCGYQPGRAALDRVELHHCALDDTRNRRTIKQESNQPSHPAYIRFPIPHHTTRPRSIRVHYART